VIGIDTNVLVRYLAQDDPRQSPLVTRFIEQQLSRSNPGHVSLVALAETVWVLGSRYGVRKADLITAIATLASDGRFVVQHERAVWLALEACENGELDLADALVCYVDREQGCLHTFTLDKKAARHAAFALLN
jgi:predicted nucleic-acid-binding protein